MPCISAQKRSQSVLIATPILMAKALELNEQIYSAMNQLQDKK